MENIQKSTLSILTFSVGNDLYGIETSYILGIVQTETVTPLPQTPPWVLGVMKLRGTLCTVIDLHKRLYERPFEHRWPLLLVSLLEGEHRICAVVDRVISVLEIEQNAIQPPEFSNAAKNRFVYAYVEINGGLIQLLSVDKLLDRFLSGETSEPH